MWHIQGSTNGVCNLMFSHVFIDIFYRGRRFYHENIEFPFLFFCESAGELAGTILVPLRLSGAIRGPLMLVSRPLGPYFGCPETLKVSQK